MWMTRVQNIGTLFYRFSACSFARGARSVKVGLLLAEGGIVKRRTCGRFRRSRHGAASPLRAFQPGVHGGDDCPVVEGVYPLPGQAWSPGGNSVRTTRQAEKGPPCKAARCLP